MTTDMHWLNPPEHWSEAEGITRVKTNAGTDFWRHTHYGFVRDSGHFRYRNVLGDCSAQVSIRGHYTTLYDQAGLMLRHDSGRWIKAGVEFTDNLLHFCVVVTNQWSDWSLIPLPEMAHQAEVGVSLIRVGRTIIIRYRIDQGTWRVARVAAFPYEDKTDIGMMCCSPERAGFEAEFRDFIVGGPVALNGM